MDVLFENVPQIVQAIFFSEKSILGFPPNVDDINYKDAQSRTPLHAAAHVGDADFVEFLLANNARVNVKDINWHTPLHNACASNASSVVQILLDNGADRNMREKNWLTPLHVAAFNGSLECARLLLFYNIEDGEFGTNINASDRDGYTPLHHAVYGGHLDMVRLLLMNRSSVNAFDKNDRRAVHWAVACNLASLIDLLCEFGAEVNCRDKSLYTPLHAAAALGHVNVAKKLMEHGADLDSLTIRGNSALHVACLNEQREVMKMILESIVSSRGASFHELLKELNKRNNDGYTPIHLAAIAPGDGGCLEELISFCKLFDERRMTSPSTSNPPLSVTPLLSLEIAGGCNSWTPLHLTAFYGRNKQAQTLLKMGVNIQALDAYGNTALHLAASRGHELVLRILLSAGAQWNAHGYGGATPLHCAAFSGYTSCFDRLMDAAATQWDQEECAVINEAEDVKERYPPYALPISSLKDNMGRNLVHAAALGGSIDCLRSVILAGGPPFEVDRFGRGALHYAILSVALARRFNENEPPVRVPTKCNSISEIVRVFLKLGMDPNIADNHGCTALHLAAAFDVDGHLTKLLLKYGADRNAALMHRPTSLLPSYLSSQDNSSSAGSHSSFATSPKLRTLEPHNSDAPHRPIVKRDSVMVVYYPLHLAAAMGKTKALEQLLQGMTRDKSCQIILDSAKMPNYVPNNEMREKQKEKGINISNLSSWYFYSPLFLAAYRGCTECVEVLLDSCKVPNTKSALMEGKEVEEEGQVFEDELSFQHFPLNENWPCGKLTDPLGRTPLHYAAHAGHLETCQLLVKHPLSQADPAFKDDVYQWTAVHHAAAQGHCSILQFLLHWHASKNANRSDLINVRDVNGRTPLMLAAQNQLLTTIHFLITFKTHPPKCIELHGRTLDAHIVRRVDLKDNLGRTALHRTAVNGQTEAMKILLEAGASLTASDKNGRQALHLAACSGQSHTLSFMLDTLHDQTMMSSDEEAKADILAPMDSRGFTPIHFAAYCNQLPCAKVLLRFKPYWSLRGNTYTPLHCAAVCEDSALFANLLGVYLPANLKIKDFRNSTPLHIAAVANNEKAVNLIIDAITDATLSNEDSFDFFLSDALSIRDSRGCTPLMAAARAGALKACIHLIDTHLDVDKDLKGILLNTDCNGLNVLHQALCASNEETALYMINQPYFQELITRSTADGRTPLHLATNSGFSNVVVELIVRGANVFHTDHSGMLPVCEVAKTEQMSQCLIALLTEMMPQLKDILETNPIARISKTSYNAMADSIRSSDSEFY